MVTVLEYLEEETSFIPDPDMPDLLGKADVLEVHSAVLTFESLDDESDSYYDSQDEEGTYPVLEITAQTKQGRKSFILISVNNEEWLFYTDIDEYINEASAERSNISFNYEVLDDES
jgi:hypothetical protein